MTVAAHPTAVLGLLEVAAEIAVELCRTALTYDGESIWLGTQQQGNGDASTSFSYTTIGSDLYGGTSGIALFLAEMHARTGESAFKTTSESASAYALANVSELPRRFRLGFYSGVVGVAYAIVRSGRALDREDFVERASTLLGKLIDQATDDTLLDVISGAAGAITPLLYLAEVLDDSRLVEFAGRLGDRIIAAAQKTHRGWSWSDSATGFVARRNLTGFAHGAAGLGWSLFELYASSGSRRFLDAAREAFGYENSVFVAERDNWPDYRFTDGRAQPAPCGLAWCFGAPGIGLSRLRALEIQGGADHRADAEAAIRAIKNTLAETPNVGSTDYSLCHGWTGIAEFLFRAEHVLGDADAGELGRRIAQHGVEQHQRTRTWHCGLLRGHTPSLMLGLAGIGHFYLRLADPKVPSVLIVPPRV